MDSSKLTTFKRKDGSRPVVYDRHALYTCVRNGPMSCEGQAGGSGELLFLIAPSGSPIKKTAESSY